MAIIMIEEVTEVDMARTTVGIKIMSYSYQSTSVHWTSGSALSLVQTMWDVENSNSKGRHRQTSE